MNLGRSMALVAAATVVLASGVVAQSPAPSVSPGPGASGAPGQSAVPSPSATPFPWPTIRRERLARGTFPEWPSGAPTATTTDRGIRLDLWLSSTEAAPGDWVQAIVRATNVGNDTAWVRTGDDCYPGTQTLVDIDLAPVTPMGIGQTGNAGVLKADLLDGSFDDHFRSPRFAYGRDATGRAVRALAECGQIHPRFLVEPLAPGHTRTERFVWRAVHIVDERRGGRLQPLYPGSVPVTAHWAIAGRGARPTQERLGRPGWPISVTAGLELTGDGPETPSLPELIDTALADPDFRAWVELDPDRRRWEASTRIPDLTNDYYNHYGRVAGILDRVPNGYLEVVLVQAGAGATNAPGVDSIDAAGAAFLDLRTGELLGTWFGPSR